MQQCSRHRPIVSGVHLLGSSQCADDAGNAAFVIEQRCRNRVHARHQRAFNMRQTASTVYCVLEGEGCTIVDGVRLDWSRNDVFTVPGWLWHNHQNRGHGDAFLYSVTDEPTMRKLGLFREEARVAS